MPERKDYKSVINKEHFDLNDLVPFLKKKDEDAFKELFFYLQPSIFYFLFRLTSNKEIAEDLTQESFVNLWISADRLDPNQSVKAYLYKIARNLAINYLNRNIQASSFREENDMITRTENYNSQIDNIFLMDDFQKAINSLPERCKSTFLLSRISQFDYSEIAEIMGVSLQTVKNQMSKALSVLRRRLIQHIE